MENPVGATVRMTKNLPWLKNAKAIERYKQPMEQHYREPVSGQFEDCTKQVLRGAKIESRSDEEDQEIPSE